MGVHFITRALAADRRRGSTDRWRFALLVNDLERTKEPEWTTQDTNIHSRSALRAV